MTDDLTVLCLLDVLGFESIFQLIGLERMKERYDKLTKYVKQQTGGIDVVPIPDGHVAVGWLVIGNAYFSDTLLFWTKYSKISLPSFTHLIAESICWGLEHELPLRGTIAVGQTILDTDSDTYLGQPIIEAARTEGTQEWIGVSLGPSFLAPDFNSGFYLHTVLPYKTITKTKIVRWLLGSQSIGLGNGVKHAKRTSAHLYRVWTRMSDSHTITRRHLTS